MLRTVQERCFEKKNQSPFFKSPANALFQTRSAPTRPESGPWRVAF
jgi:hypothetical protein